MSSPILTEPVAVQAPPPANPPARRSCVVIEDKACIPAWVDDLESFRRWAHSYEFPERGSFSYLNGEIWVDLSMEELFSHNQVKGEFTAVLGAIAKLLHLGYFICDRMLLTNPAANLSTEPDGCFGFWETVKSGRLRFVPGVHGGYMELEGTPDMVLEVVSGGSVKKDTVRLHELYWRAGITEYWLVDARAESLRFDIFRHTKDGYAPAEAQDGWLFSTVFGHAFRLIKETDPLGYPLYRLQRRSPEPSTATNAQ
jgi:Uma2 family endonuclease